MSNMQELLSERDQLLFKQQQLFVTSINNINMRYSEFIRKDLGKQLLFNCAKDTAGEIVRRYFDTSDYYITADQMFDRIIHFSYDNDVNPLLDSDDAIRKNLYNMNDLPGYSSTLDKIAKNNQEAQRKLFKKENGKYVDSKLMEDGKNNYRKNVQDANGVLYDELTGNSSNDERLEVDHIQSASAARYNSRYFKSPEVIEELKKFYNSDDNFQMLEKRANGSKGDVRVYSDGKKILTSEEIKAIKDNIRGQKKEEYLQEGLSEQEAGDKASTEADNVISSKYDITYKAEASQVADAVCDRWENANEETKKELQRTGKLDENGKVPADVRKKLEDNLRSSMNKESKIILKTMLTEGRGQLLKDSWSLTKSGFTKILAGQIVYYALPPVVFETQCILKKKGLSVKEFFIELDAAGKRIIKYLTNNIGNILKNTLWNGLTKFCKSFFDILIDALKETVKRLVKIAKQVVLSLIQCVKVLVSKDSSPESKKNSIVMILSTTITSVVLEVLFEYLEKGFSLPDVIMEPLQLIVTVVATNIVMLLLQEADFFDVRYGLLVENIQSSFDEEREQYELQSHQLFLEAKNITNTNLESLKNELQEIRTSISSISIYDDSVSEALNRINEIYDMGIDFDAAWNTFRNGEA